MKNTENNKPSDRESIDDTQDERKGLNQYESDKAHENESDKGSNGENISKGFVQFTNDISFKENDLINSNPYIDKENKCCNRKVDEFKSNKHSTNTNENKKIINIEIKKKVFHIKTANGNIFTINCCDNDISDSKYSSQNDNDEKYNKNGIESDIDYARLKNNNTNDKKNNSKFRQKYKPKNKKKNSYITTYKNYNNFDSNEI